MTDVPHHPTHTAPPSRLPRFPLLGKGLAVGAVMVALTVALGSVGHIVQERENRLREAERSVADSLASGQMLLGPVLTRRCDETWSVEQGEGKARKRVTERREFMLSAAPQTLVVDAKATLEARHRGIFKVNGYSLHTRLKAGWADLAALQPSPQHTGSALHCEAPLLFVAVGDARGIRNASITVDGNALAVLPGTGPERGERGFHGVLPSADASGARLAEVSLDLVGTGDLAFAPVADSTQVSLSSDWPRPSFGSRFLPTTRQVDVGVGGVEVMRRLRVHPVQYLLVGSAVAIFFLLLVSLSEHIAFGWAYLAGASACTLLLSFYGSFVLQGWRAGAVFGLGVASLYGALFVLLQMEQSARVLGTLLLFAVLAAVMVATRRIDWYTLFESLRREAPPRAAPALQ
jgi:inner membrane protein involved in colicin E2 resistance